MDILEKLNELYHQEKQRAYRMEYNGQPMDVVRSQLNYAHGILKAKQIVEEYLNEC